MRIALFLVAAGMSFLSFAKPPSKFRFIENKNQWETGTDFVSRIPGGELHVRPGSFTYYILDQQKIEDFHFHQLQDHAASEAQSKILVDGVKINVTFLGADQRSKPTGINRSEQYYNYFLGNDRSKWASRVYGYDGFFYPDIYAGIDLQMYTAGDHLKYDLVAAPGADPSLIRIRYEGPDEVMLENGDLYARTKLGDIIEKSPVAYQFINGRRVFVKCEFVLEHGVLSFSFPDGFDACHELVIDPLLIFSTYSGANADNWGSTATPGERGTLYSAGIASHNLTNGLNSAGFSGTFPATSGAFQKTYGGEFDVAILKYDSLGRNVLYASYLGGSNCESPHSLVVNKNNELIVLGTTESSNFPATANAYKTNFSGGTLVRSVFYYENGTDIFLAKISADGTSLLASTYLGGAENDGGNFVGSELRRNYGDDLRGDVITDDQNNIYISSVTQSSNLATLNTYQGGFSDAYLAKFSPDLKTMIWSRYIGGTGHDAAHTMKFSQGHLYVAGGTTSADFPMSGSPAQPAYAGGVDGWIARLTLDGQNITNATFTGSGAFDMVYFLDVNATGEVYVYGQTNGQRPVFPDDIYRDENSGQFLQKFNPDLSEALFYTVFGSGKGSPDISPTAFLVNDCNNLFMAGWGGSLNLEMSGGNAFDTHTFSLAPTADAYQSTTLGHDFYLIVLSSEAKEKLYATFLGGSARTHVDGGTSRFDKQGVVYHAVCAGCRGIDDFPTTANAVSRVNNSLNCNNAAFKFDLSSLRALIEIKGSDVVCMPEKVVLQNVSIGGERFFWNFGDGTPILEQTDPLTVEHEYKNPGKYRVWLKAYDPGTCKTSDSVAVVVTVGIAEAAFPESAVLCEGTSHTLTASGGVAYEWISKDGKYNFNSPSITVSPSETTMFYINVFEKAGCVSRDSVLLTVIPKLVPEFSFSRAADCIGGTHISVKNLTDSLLAGDQLFFDFGDGTTSDLEEVDHAFTGSGRFNVKLVAIRDFCVTETVVPMDFGALKFPNVITPGLADDKNDSFAIQFGDNPDLHPDDLGFRTGIVIYDRWGRLVYESDDYRSDWRGDDLVSGVYYYEVTIDDHATCKGWVHLVK